MRFSELFETSGRIGGNLYALTIYTLTAIMVAAMFSFTVLAGMLSGIEGAESTKAAGKIALLLIPGAVCTHATGALTLRRMQDIGLPPTAMMAVPAVSIAAYPWLWVPDMWLAATALPLALIASLIMMPSDPAANEHGPVPKDQV